MLIALALPILLMLLSGYAFNLDLTEIRLGVIAENPTPLVNSLVNDLTHSSSFRITYAHDRTDLEKKLVSNDLRGLIIIPERFEKELVEPGNGVPTLQLLTDGTEPNTALLLKNFVQGVTQIGWAIISKIRERG